MNLIFLGALIILSLVWIENYNYMYVHRKVKDRWSNGDKTCGCRKEWWGWRVEEYAEDADTDL